MLPKDIVNKKALGQRLRQLRKEKDITGDALSEQCDIHVTYYRQIETAVRLPSLSLLVHICNKTKTSPSFFLKDSLMWDEDDRVTAIAEKIRGLSPQKQNTAIDTITAMLDGMASEDSNT